MKLQTAALVALVAASTVAINLSSTHFGPDASIYNAFVFVGVILTARDRLYDLWGRNRFRNMALLILAGSVVSYFAAKWIGAGPPDVVARIALASCLAFAVAETWDTIVYHLLRRHPWLERSGASNVVGAAADSLIFVAVAFGWLWPVIFAQFTAKVAGGFCWGLALRYLGRIPETETA